MLAGQLALVLAAAFAGAAFYVGFAEHPARLSLDDQNLLKQWKLSMPTNRKLNAIAQPDAGPAARGLLQRWARLHAVRTVLVSQRR
jgi:hypothetical protein